MGGVIPFTLLLCTYEKDNPVHLAQSIDSIIKQTVLPSEWLIVKDGPLTESLEAVIRSISFPNEIRILTLPENVTLGPARMEGTKAASNDWIALMDSDDVCLPDRFEKQLALINSNPELCIVGGQIIEYDDIPGTELAVRKVPTTHADILTRTKKRNPFSAMTVMFKRDLALAAGGFRYHPGFEDYDLWTRMIVKGAKCANHPDVLAYVRAGMSLYARRKGIGYIRSEWKMQMNLKNLGINSPFTFLLNLMLRVPIRLLPTKTFGWIYKRFARV